MSFVAELKRRNVFRVAVLYLVAGWVVLQVGDVVFPALGVPDWGLGLVLGLLILGFPIALIFSWIYELTPEGIKREKDIDRSQSVTAETGQKINVTIIALLVVAIGVIVADRLIPEAPVSVADETDEPPAVADTPEPAPADAGADASDDAPADSTDPAEAAASMFMNTAPEQSVAVLPFVNMSGDAQNEFFSDGLSEELLNVLAKVPDLFVAARTSSFHFKGHTGDIADIARRLRVRNVLEGSVRKSGSRVRITAQLIDASNGYHLWSDTYDRTLEDVFAVQDEIASHVAEALKVALLDEGAAQPEHPTEVIDAYLAYLQGQQALGDAGEGGYQRAIEAFAKATALDPKFAEAHAGLAIAWGNLLEWGNTSRQEGEAPLKAAAARAIELDDGLALAWVAHGIARRYDSEFLTENAAALESLERAYRLAPDDATVIYWYSEALHWNGRTVEGIVPIERALVRDPYSPALLAQLAQAQSAQGNKDAARESYRKVAELAPRNPTGPDGVAVVERGRGRFDESIVWQHRTLQIDPTDTYSAAIMATDYLELDDPGRAGEWLAVARDMDADAAMTRYASAVLALYQGDVEQARAEARRYFDDGLAGQPGPSVLWMFMIRSSELLASGQAEQAVSLAMEGTDRNQRIDTTTSGSDLYAFLIALPALAVADPDEARKVGNALDRVVMNNEARLSSGSRAALGCSAAAWQGNVQVAIPRCQRVLVNNASAGYLFWRFSELFDPIRDEPAWRSFMDEVRADRATRRERLKASGAEPVPAKPVAGGRET
jgi:TolB-like protein/Flp pilus assembly protein TadD